MKKTGIAIAAALLAMTGLFAQPSAKGKKAEGKTAPEFKAPPKIELPAEADVKAYHEAQREALKILLDAQVKAKIITPEWAEAKMAILKAVQADCKGWCIVFKKTDVPFGSKPRFGGPAPFGFGGPRPDFAPCHHFGPRDHRHGDFRRKGHGDFRPGHDMKGRPQPRPRVDRNEAEDIADDAE